MAERLYFAYGSNINLEQMAVRCPAAQVVGPAVLDGYELLFRGNRRGTRRRYHRAFAWQPGPRPSVEADAGV